MLLAQLVRPEILSRLTDSQISILNSVVEAELVQNASIRRALTSATQPMTRGLSAAGGAARTAGKKK